MSKKAAVTEPAFSFSRCSLLLHLPLGHRFAEATLGEEPSAPDHHPRSNPQGSPNPKLYETLNPQCEPFPEAPTDLAQEPERSLGPGTGAGDLTAEDR